MKALQAKRNSLRSLWKGSLVVLSVLALAFVFSCDNSSSSGSPDPRPADPGPVIVGFEVIRNPTGPSFEGAAPVLDGMLVRFSYSDGTAVTIDDPRQFRAIVPGHEALPEFQRFDWPVQKPGPNELPTARQAQRTVMVSHIGSGFVFEVVVPEVLRLWSVEQVGTGLAPSGQRYYEDELWPFIPETTGLRLMGHYLVDNDPGVSLLTIPREIPILQNPGYFRVVPDPSGEEKHKAAYLISRWWDGAPVHAVDWVHSWDIDKIWWIDRVEFKDITGTALQGRIYADAYAFFKDRNDRDEVEKWWFDALERMGLEFNVYYYGYTGGPKVRTMAQYRAAKAWDGSRADAFPAVTSAIEDRTIAPALHHASEYEVTLALQYFSNREILLGRAQFGWTLEVQNTISVPLTERGLVFLHAGMGSDWKEGFTDQHDGAEALLYGQSRNDLVDALRLYWDVFHIYVNPNNANETFNVNVTNRAEWLAAAGRANVPRFINAGANEHDFVAKVPIGDSLRFEFEDEGGIQYMDLEFLFPLPRSVQTSFNWNPLWITDGRVAGFEPGEIALPFRILPSPPVQ